MQYTFFPMGTKLIKKASGGNSRSDGMGDAVPLLKLKDQVKASAAAYKGLEGSALWVVLGMYRAFAVLDRDQTEEIAAIGLSTLQFNILTALQRANQPMTMGALAAMLVVQPTNLSGNISALSEKGFVRRELNDNDRRSLLAVLTPAGEKLLERVLPGHWQRLEVLMGDLSRRQRLTLIALLKRLAGSVESRQLPFSGAMPAAKTRSSGNKFRPAEPGPADPVEALHQ